MHGPPGISALGESSMSIGTRPCRKRSITHMRPTFLLAGLVLAAAAPATARAAAPYPASTAVPGLTWDTATYSYGAVGGDIWPITWHGDGTLRAAYGDGQIDCPAKVSYGVVAIPADAPSLAGLWGVGCGPTGTGKGKIRALGAVGGDLYATMNPQGTTSGYPILRSADGGRSWTRGFSPSWLAESFVNFGRGNEGAPDDYLYLLDAGTTAVKLGRVRPEQWNVGTAYQWFSGTAATPAWSGNRGAAKPIFADPAGVAQPTLQWVPGLRRYLLAAAHTGPGQVGVFESENLWGPWRTVHYTESWLELGTRGSFKSVYFPLKWQSADGRRGCRAAHRRLHALEGARRLPQGARAAAAGPQGRDEHGVSRPFRDYGKRG
jgi:hypothetical protein